MQGIDLQPSERSLAMTPDQARAEPPGLLALALSFARIGMSSFGASAPFQELYKHFGITSEAIVAATKKRLSV